MLTRLITIVRYSRITNVLFNICSSEHLSNNKRYNTRGLVVFTCLADIICYMQVLFTYSVYNIHPVNVQYK